MAVRVATKEDLPLFLELWTEFLLETIKNGRGHVVPTHRTMETMAKYFDAYASGVLRGVTVFGADDQAVTIWGELPDNGMDDLYDPQVLAWGTYVRPEARNEAVAFELMRAAKTALSEKGIKYAIGGAPVTEGGIAAIQRGGGKALQFQVLSSTEE